MSKFLRTDKVGEAVNWQFSALGGSAASNPYTSNTRGASMDTASQHSHDNSHPEYQRGLRQGLSEGFRAGAAQQAHEQHTLESARSARIDALIASMQQQFVSMDHDVAKALTELAFKLAKQVLRHEISAHPAQVCDVVKDALNELGARVTHPTLWLHPDDLDLVTSSLSDLMTIRGCQVQTDYGIRRGGCRVACDTLTIDASIETRWQRALSSMGYTDAPMDATLDETTSTSDTHNAEDLDVAANR